MTVTIEVHRTRDERAAADAALVLSAAGIRHSRTFGHGWHRIFVEESLAREAAAEISEFESENGETTPQLPSAVRRASPWPGVIVYVVVLWALFLLDAQTHSPDYLGRHGSMSSTRIQGGEWWRCGTALTLHLDFMHVLGNMFFGAVFGGFLSTVLGNGLAWGTIVASGFFGNLINAWTKDEGFLAIGASTAVFGALGALVAWQWTFGRSSNVSLAKRLAPVAMGIVMLSFVGAGGGGEGDNTDVMAHVWGFVAGVLIGLAHMHWTAHRTPSTQTQLSLGVGTLGFLGLTWALALS